MESPRKMNRERGGALFYWVLLPLLTLVNLLLGVGLLVRLEPAGWEGWMELTAGALCCGVAGWLAAAGWSKSYWGAAMNSQVTRWSRMADVIFNWIEEAPVPPDAMRRLHGSLKDIIEDDLEPVEAGKTKLRTEA